MLAGLGSLASRLGPHGGSEPAVGGIDGSLGTAEAGFKARDKAGRAPNVQHVPRLFTAARQHIRGTQVPQKDTRGAPRASSRRDMVLICLLEAANLGHELLGAWPALQPSGSGIP